MIDAIICIAVTVGGCFGIHWFWFQRKKRNWERTSLVTLAACLAAVLGLSTLAAFPNEGPSAIFTGIGTVFDVLDGSSDDFRTALSVIPVIPELLSCAVPVLTVSAALSLLWNYLPHHVPFFKKEWYLFSALDANSVRMAKDLTRQDRLCIFLRTRRNKADAELLAELVDIPFFLYPGDEARFLRWFPRRWHILRFFFLSEKTDENFDRMQEFLKAVNDKNLFKPVGEVRDDFFRQELYLLSETESAPMLIDHLRKMMDGVKRFRNTELRLLDRYRAISYDLLREKPLHAHIRDGRLNILMLGFGKIGREFFRAACSLSIFPDCETEFTICDLQITEKLAMFESQCPELRASVAIDPQPLNAETDALDKLLGTKDYHYIVVALGDDERNIRVASRLKRSYRLRHWERLANKRTDNPHPQICVNIEDAIKRDYTQKLWTEASERQNVKGWDNALHVFGGLDQVFTRRVLMPRSLWNAARFIHRELKKTIEERDDSDNLPIPVGKLNWVEYERRSSIASAVRAEYLCDIVCGDENRKEYKRKLTNFNQSQLADTEHLRWMAYVRSEGLRYVGTELVDVYYDADNGRHVDILGKLTPCLTEKQSELETVWNHLSEGPHAANYDGKLSFRDRDETLVKMADKIADRARPPKS